MKILANANGEAGTLDVTLLQFDVLPSASFLLPRVNKKLHGASGVFQCFL